MLKIYSSKKTFSILSKMREVVNPKAAEEFSLATKSLKLKGLPFLAKKVTNSGRICQTSNLANGVQVVTENSSLPGTVSMGVLLNVGTRDEDKKTSGALHSIKTTYYKSNFNSNETINYGMVQMAGARYDMSFDRETALFKASCLSHDVVDIFNMLTDCVLEPRSFVTANAAIEKLGHSHKLESVKGGSSKFTDKILGAVYGTEGIGMPLLGAEKNIINLDAFTLQRFQMENIKPEEIVVAGVGVENHGEFLELAEMVFGSLKNGGKREARVKSVFNEVDLKTFNSASSKTEGVLLLESTTWTGKDLVLNFLLKQLLGSADVNGSCSNGLLSSELYQKQKSVYSAEAFNIHFTDTGLFGLRLVSEGNAFNASLEQAVKILRSLSTISAESLESAKRQLKIRILESLGKDYQRVEEIMKQKTLLGHVDIPKIVGDINGVTVESFTKFVDKLSKSKKALIVEGSQSSIVHSLDKVKELFK